jgi:nucleoside-diphosphate-sugar epimerase
MAIAVITGSAGLVGAEASRFFAGKGFDIVGIDNDMRREFFGDDASTAWSRRRLEAELTNLRHRHSRPSGRTRHLAPLRHRCRRRHPYRRATLP